MRLQDLPYCFSNLNGKHYAIDFGDAVRQPNSNLISIDISKCQPISESSSVAQPDRVAQWFIDCYSDTVAEQNPNSDRKPKCHCQLYRICVCNANRNTNPHIYTNAEP